MIISRTPLRCSFFGGGSDYPQWYIEHGGAVLGATINKYCYVMLHDGKVWHTFDLPNKSGLGSSSAYTVGLLRVCSIFEPKMLANLATVWEYDKMGGNIGAQDQYLCAMGGFRFIRFNEHGIRDKLVSPELIKPLEKYLMLFDTFQYRRAGDVVAHQLKEMKRHRKLLLSMMSMAEEGLKVIQNKDYMSFGRLLDEAWCMKKQLSKYISTTTIDDIYDTAMKAGAIGGKLLGAGGGGFIIFFVEPDKQEIVKSALSELNHIPFEFEYAGSQIIYDNNKSKV